MSLDIVSPQKTASVSRRKVRNGIATNDLVLRAYDDGNENVFPRVLDLYVKEGSTIADVIFGKGVFWRHISKEKYNLIATGIQGGVDCRNLPYDDESLDCVVLDPPYMHSPGGTAHTVHKPFENHCGNNASGNRTGGKYHEAVLEFYVEAAKEVHRIL